MIRCSRRQQSILTSFYIVASWNGQSRDHQLICSSTKMKVTESGMTSLPFLSTIALLIRLRIDCDCMDERNV